MKAIVVDASIAIKWFIPEIHAIAAARLLNKNLQLIAPDLLFAEFGNILWKKCRAKELNNDIAINILKDFKRLPLNSYEAESLIDLAWEIANLYQCTVYDSVYVALAQSEGSLLVTADRKLYNLLNATHLAHLLLWVEDVNKIN